MPRLKGSQGRRLFGAAVLTLLVGLVAAPAGVAATAPADFDFSGYATSTVVHAHAIQAGTTRVADAEVAFSGASVASKGLTELLVNEMQAVVRKASETPDKKTHARGSGLEIGVAQSVPVIDPAILLAGKAEASAPPTGPTQTKEIVAPSLDPVAYASLLRGQATARWRDDACILGSDLSRGLGYAADAQLLDTGGGANAPALDAPVVAADAPNPERAVSNSVSRTTLVPQMDRAGNFVGTSFGLMAETRQTIAPVTLFKGMPNQLTIEFLGEWVLRAVATGVPGNAWVHYGPGTTSPEAHVLRLIQGVPETEVIEVTLQQLLGPSGLVVPIPGIGEVAIGEDPRAIGGTAASQPTQDGDGTEASAAVDVVRVKLLGQPIEVLDLRVGHMEVRAKVPQGGIGCEIPVTKTPDPKTVGVGQQFKTDITILNPFDCDLVDVVARDDITTTRSARYRVDGVSEGGTASGGSDKRTITWNIGTIPRGGSKTVSATFTATAGPGDINDEVRVTGTCGMGGVDGKTTVQVPVSGVAAVSVPVARVAGVTVLPVTGGPTYAILGAAAAMALLALGIRFAGHRLLSGGGT